MRKTNTKRKSQRNYSRCYEGGYSVAVKGGHALIRETRERNSSEGKGRTFQVEQHPQRLCGLRKCGEFREDQDGEYGESMWERWCRGQ